MIIDKDTEIEKILVEYNQSFNQKQLLNSLKVICGDKPEDEDEQDPDPSTVNVTFFFY